MTTAELATFIAPHLAPARRIAVEANRPKTELVLNSVVPVARPSTRTYYLGANGRVSQRKHLVGEVIATTRAYTTNMAWSQFTEQLVTIQFMAEREVRKPYIGHVPAEGLVCTECGFTAQRTVSQAPSDQFICAKCNSREVNVGPKAPHFYDIYRKEA